MTTSSDKNPYVKYTLAGNKTVKLTVTNSSGSDSEIKTDFIKVTAA
jgi:PKD repeat protein